MSVNDKAYDVLVYHDFTSSEYPEKGKPFPGFGDELRVLAIGPGIHEGRVTVVLGHGASEAPEIEKKFAG